MLDSLMAAISAFLAREKATLSSLKWKAKIAHLWEYYRYWALLTVGIIMILVFSVRGWIYNTQDVTISGLFLNVGTRIEGYDHLSYEYEALLRDGERADLIEMLVVEYTQGEQTGEGTSTIGNIDAMVSSRSLDYIILDETALTYFGPLEMCADLQQVLTDEQLARLQDRLVTCFGLDKKQDYAAAIDITDSPFAQVYGLTNTPAYLIILANAPAEPAAITAFIDYFFTASS